MSAKHHSPTKYIVEEVTAYSKVQSFSDNTHQRNWDNQVAYNTSCVGKQMTHYSNTENQMQSHSLLENGRQKTTCT